MNYKPYVPPANQATRPGAEDALKVPSIANGVRIPYKKPIAACVGVNKIVPIGYPR